MILDDKYLMARLSSEPEFAIRLEELVTWHGLAEKPTLIVQARPGLKASRSVDLKDAGLVQRFRNGRLDHENWWDGFRSMVSPVETFHGIAGLPTTHEPGWTTELHQDGHLIAAIWRFPELPHRARGEVAAVPAFYKQFFTQFFELAAALFASPAASEHWKVTATLLQARQLHYADKTWGNQYGLTGGESPLQHWQWLVTAAELGSEEWTSLGERMGSQLRGAFKVS